MRISEYPLAAGISPTDLFIFDGASGTKVITGAQLAHDLYEITSPNPIDASLDVDQKMVIYKDGQYYAIKPTDAFYQFYGNFIEARENKRFIRRNKYLGNKPTTAQMEAIYNGTFEDLYIGDHWSIDSTGVPQIQAIIADINYSIPHPSKNISETAEQYPNIVLWGDYYSFGDSAVEFESEEALTALHFKYWKPPQDILNINANVRAAFEPFSALVVPQDLYLHNQPLTADKDTRKTLSYGTYSGFGIVPTISMMDDSFFPFLTIMNESCIDDIRYYMSHHQPMLNLFKDQGMMMFSHSYSTEYCFSGAYGYLNCGSMMFTRTNGMITPRVERLNAPIMSDEYKKASIQYHYGCHFPLVYCIRGTKKLYYIL